MAQITWNVKYHAKHLPRHYSIVYRWLINQPPSTTSISLLWVRVATTSLVKCLAHHLWTWAGCIRRFLLWLFNVLEHIFHELQLLVVVQRSLQHLHHLLIYLRELLQARKIEK